MTLRVHLQGLITKYEDKLAEFKRENRAPNLHTRLVIDNYITFIAELSNALKKEDIN